ERVVLERPDVWNAHAQFQATDNATLLVQVNRGARFAPNGERLTRYGPEGNTLMLLDIHSGALRPLAVGRPHTTSPTGHECWLGQTQTVLATIFRPGQSPLPGPDPEMGLAPDLGTVITLRENEAYRQVPSGQVLMHIGSTFDGRFYHGDWIEQDRLVIGSARTGRAVIVYRDPAASDDCPFDQHSHPHAYLTDNGRWMIFNSDRTGRPQIYAARIPPALLEEVERGS
ncbi:MAG: oligogalacturonate lyase family protein, partial [Candidatus Marinimicrobia bacterium]|nr:oligogalacturonate lyase family protein [Candidatus Neomarinimicrobiota bacterium]